MPFVVIIRALWRMLDHRQRVLFVLLAALLVASGSLEMLGMIVLFGYVAGLQQHPVTGTRSGPLARLLERALGEHIPQMTFVVWGGALVIGYMFVKNLESTAARFALNRFFMKFNQRVSSELYRGYMLAPYELFSREGVQQPAAKIGKLFRVFSTCFNSTTLLIADSSILLMVGALLVYIDPRLTALAGLIFAAVGLGVYASLQGLQTRMAEQENTATGRMKRFLNHGMEGLVDVRMRGSSSYFFKNYAAALGRSAVLQRRRDALKRLPRSANEIALASMIVGAVLYVTLGGHSVKEALPTLGVFGFAALRMSGVLSRVNVAAQSLKVRLPQFLAAQDLVVEFAPHLIAGHTGAKRDYLSDEVPLPAGVDGRMKHRLELQDVSFAYPGKRGPVVRNVSLTVQKGQFISICGPSGGGKSTLLLLAMGLVKPNSGQILCDDWSIFGHIQPWHRNIGYVGQSIFLVDGTVRENVAFGSDPSAVEDAKVWRALQVAAAEGFVRELPEQLDTQVGEGGRSLSGGQRQRLVIARALYHDPELIILDEATAALDNVTEREVTDAIIGLTGQKTVLCVAHRLGTIRNSNCILFMKKGEIVARGTYDELLEQSPDFAKMVHASSEGAGKSGGKRKGKSKSKPAPAS